MFLERDVNALFYFLFVASGEREKGGGDDIMSAQDTPTHKTRASRKREQKKLISQHTLCPRTYKRKKNMQKEKSERGVWEQKTGEEGKKSERERLERKGKKRGVNESWPCACLFFVCSTFLVKQQKMKTKLLRVLRRTLSARVFFWVKVTSRRLSNDGCANRKRGERRRAPFTAGMKR